MQYEILYLIGESKKTNLESIKAEVKQIITQEGGAFIDPEVTKERKMSYQIQKDIRGIYIAQRFNTAGKDAENYNPDAIPNAIRKLTLNSNILRFLIVNAAELPELKERDEAQEKAKKAERSTRNKLGEKKEVRKESVRFTAPKKTVPAPAAAPVATEPQNDIDKKLDEILKI